jgi:hypothetical protein
MQCEDGYQPASCVSICEQSDIDIEACDAPFQALLHCFRTTPGALDALCVYTPPPIEGGSATCRAERDILGFCIGEQQLATGR